VTRKNIMMEVEGGGHVPSAPWLATPITDVEGGRFLLHAVWLAFGIIAFVGVTIGLTLGPVTTWMGDR